MPAQALARLIPYALDPDHFAIQCANCQMIIWDVCCHDRARPHLAAQVHGLTFPEAFQPSYVPAGLLVGTFQALCLPLDLDCPTCWTLNRIPCPTFGDGGKDPLVIYGGRQRG